ncbi:hypothetical protein H5187_08095 [Pseudoalteromonas sp. SG44-1]|uniref:hypothetical protein n=1 Tax=Pseudoalteromonas sp. SG44-1 TaxID=2760964 RepID=UPI0016005F2D|nr:hypothetical protein [Pseudoalteromonas sp. SG44-1]MBB1417237.1 hypothetical protein [Pseudoalteromonas sp. SG44-1]
MKNIALTFTARGFERILREGGSGEWTADPLRVSDNVKYVICCQNTNPQRKGNDWGEVSHKHGQGFIVGKLSEVVLTTKDTSKKKRYRFMFSEYAELEIDHMWRGDRFPVRYLSENDLPFNIRALDFKPMPKFETSDQIFTLKEAKDALAKAHGIKESEVRIVL